MKNTFQQLFAAWKHPAATITPFDSNSHSTDAVRVKDESETDDCRKRKENSRITHHIVILKHGILGNRKELGYVKKALEREYRSSSDTVNSTLHVHSAECNEKNSLDGIEQGGRRFANEINDVVRSVATNVVRDRSSSEDDAKNTTITLSIIGFSLGGLYARFALRYLDWSVQIEKGSESPCIELQIIPQLFVTIATPHLGMKKFSHGPRCLEAAVAIGLGQSGRDLFRCGRVKKKNSGSFLVKRDPKTDSKSQETNQSKYNDIIAELCLDPNFIQPLSRFSRRIAYASAFYTDIVVPTATAAFLVDDDDDTDDSNPQDSSSRFSQGAVSERSPHILLPRIEEERETNDQVMVRTSPKEGSASRFSLLQFDTPRTTDGDNIAPEPATSDPPTVAEMARSLDSLGWSKVFIDFRPQISGLYWQLNRHKLGSPPNSLAEFVDSENDVTRVDKSCYSSGELKRSLSHNGVFGHTLPLAHSFAVASSKNPLHRLMYKNGQPFVDEALAKNAVRDLLRFVPPAGHHVDSADAGEEVP